VRQSLAVISISDTATTAALTHSTRRWKAPSTADKSGGSTDRGFISYADGEKLVIADHFGPGMVFWIYYTHDNAFIKRSVCVVLPSDAHVSTQPPNSS